MNRFLWMIGFVSCGFMTIVAGEPPERESDEAAIRKAVAAYVDAFNIPSSQVHSCCRHIEEHVGYHFEFSFHSAMDP
jgi:hypothetical protein